MGTPKTSIWLKFSLVSVLALFNGCDGANGIFGNGEDQNQGGCGPDGNCGPNGPGGGPQGATGQLAIAPAVDLKDAFSVAVVDESDGAALRLIDKHNERITSFGLTDAPEIVVNSSEDMELTGSFASVNGQPFAFPVKGKGLNLTEGDSVDGDPRNGNLTVITESGDVKEAVISLDIDKILQDHQGDVEAQVAAIESILEGLGAKESEEGRALVESVRELGGWSNGGGPQNQPRISTIAKSPTGQVFIQFERGFLYRDVPPDEDGWDNASGYQCQIFQVKGDIEAILAGEIPTIDNLICLDNKHFIDQWRVQDNGVFQFDADGKLYYPGSIPNNPGTVVYRLDPSLPEDPETKDKSKHAVEMINANINTENFLVTASGGVFYVGNSGHGGGGNDGFFRYIWPENSSAGSGVINIAFGWWNFIFDIASTSSGDTAVFFGPDPRIATTASWDTACLFNFDPAGGSSPEDRITETISCGNNIWAWMELTLPTDKATYGTGKDSESTYASWKAERKNRCHAKGNVFAGGGSQISAIKQTSTDIMVIGNVRQKNAGVFSCSVEVRGAHCVYNDMPRLKDSNGNAITTEALCKAAWTGATWEDKGDCSQSSGGNSDDFASCMGYGNTWSGSQCTDKTDTSKILSDYTTEAACTGTAHGRYWNAHTKWYNDVTTDICTSTAEKVGTDRTNFHDWNNKANRYTQTTTATDATVVDEITDYQIQFIVNNVNCQAETSANGGDSWTTELRALGKVNSTTKDLSLYSVAQEQSLDLWVVHDKVYYSSFDANLGKYLLNDLVDGSGCVAADYTSQSTCSTAGLAWSDAARRCEDSTLTTEATCRAGGKVWHTVRSRILIEDFEAYDVSPHDRNGALMVNGLNFATNEYQTGSIDPANPSTLNLIPKLTGIVEQVVVIAD